MAKRTYQPTTLAFSVERMRQHMLEQVRVPPAMIQRTLDKLSSKLEAKETKFFTHQGEVVQQVEVEDHGTQLSAVDKILSMAGLYARERDSQPPQAAVAVEVDSKTGVVRMVIGGTGGVAPPLSVDSQPHDIEDDPRQLALPEGPPEQEVDHVDTPEVIRVRKGRLPAEVYDAVFGAKGDG